MPPCPLSPPHPKWGLSGSPLDRNRSGRLPSTGFWASKLPTAAFAGSRRGGRHGPGSPPERAACLGPHWGSASPGTGSCSTVRRPPDRPCRFPAPGPPSGLEPPATQPPAPAAKGQLGARGPCEPARGAIVTRRRGRPCVVTPWRLPWRPRCVDAVELDWKPGSPWDTTAPQGRKPGDGLLTSAGEADASGVTGATGKLPEAGGTEGRRHFCLFSFSHLEPCQHFCPPLPPARKTKAVAELQGPGATRALSSLASSREPRLRTKSSKHAVTTHVEPVSDARSEETV